MPEQQNSSSAKEYGMKTTSCGSSGFQSRKCYWMHRKATLEQKLIDPRKKKERRRMPEQCEGVWDEHNKLRIQWLPEQEMLLDAPQTKKENYISDEVKRINRKKERKKERQNSSRESAKAAVATRKKRCSKPPS